VAAISRVDGSAKRTSIDRAIIQLVSRNRYLRSVAGRLSTSDEDVASVVAEPLHGVLGTMPREFARLTRHVLDVVREEKICRRFMSASGVGPIMEIGGLGDAHRV
jgi:hypothetical protein